MNKYLVTLPALLAGVTLLSASGAAAPAASQQGLDDPEFGYVLIVQQAPLVRGRTTRVFYTAAAESVRVLRVTLLPLPKGLRLVRQGSTPYVIDPVLKRPTWVLRNMQNPRINRRFVFKVRVLPTSPLYIGKKRACIRLKQVIVKATEEYPDPGVARTCLRVVKKK